MEKKNFCENENKLIASEFVSFGHPDKIADQIADAILDEFLRKDINARTGIEVMVKDNIVVLGGEINSITTIDYEKVVRNVYSKLNFPSNHHLSPNEIKIINLIGKQSEEIHSGVDKEYEMICNVLKVQELEARPGLFEHRIQYIYIEETSREDIIHFIFEEERKIRKKQT